MWWAAGSGLLAGFLDTVRTLDERSQLLQEASIWVSSSSTALRAMELLSRYMGCLALTMLRNMSLAFRVMVTP
jgi:hypothetical protein